ncbi:hypothetical protein HYN78_11370 [Vibrio parahaemolyticus]|nr:hypothetical protein [Vibrio parahaemolyticus]MBM5196131.1 hypothetical protein [Vibrio parahaemolyticus]
MIASKSILTAMILGLAGGASCATAAQLPRCPTVTEQRNPYDYHYARLMESKLYSRDFKINVAQGVDNGLSDEEALEYGRAKIAAQTDDCIYEKIKGDSTSAAIAEIRRICRSRALINI